MPLRAVEPNGITYSNAIATCEICGQTALALQIYRRACSRGFFQSIRRSINLIDLHDLVVPVAKIAVRAAVEDLQEKICFNDNCDISYELTVITGQGIHSEGGESVIKPAIIALCQDHSNWHGLHIQCKEYNSNPGRLQLTMIPTLFSLSSSESEEGGDGTDNDGNAPVASSL